MGNFMVKIMYGGNFVGEVRADHTRWDEDKLRLYWDGELIATFISETDNLSYSHTVEIGYESVEVYTLELKREER
jgi:hypothetical protein